MDENKIIEEFEKVIIKALFTNDLVRDKVVPLMDVQWFRGNNEMIEIVEAIQDFIEKYETMPIPLELRRLLKNENTVKYFNDGVNLPDEVITEFILDEIQDFVKGKLKYNIAQDIVKSIQFPNDKTIDTAFADRMVDAEGFNFDDSIGLDYLEEMDRIYDEAIKNEVLVRTGLSSFDDMLKGGFHEKSLSLILSPTNVGKTLIMCSLATNMLRMGKKVLYVTFEDSELKIGARITQNLCDVSQDQLRLMSKEDYIKCKNKFKAALTGGLIIKEYPEGEIKPLQLKSLLKELKEKKKFVPDVMFVDYIGCMMPNGKDNPNLNTNTILQRVAAQVRAISMDDNIRIPIISAEQTNRDGLDKASISMNQAADSFGQNQKADFVVGVTQTPEMKEQELYSMEVKKTRFGNNKNMVSTVRVDIGKQRILDLIGTSNVTYPSPSGMKSQTGSGMGMGDAVKMTANNAMEKMLTDDWQ